MTTAPLPPTDAQAMQAEIDTLRAELSVQRSDVHRRRRTAVAWVLAVLAILATTMALTTTWTYRTLNNTDLFVSRVGPIIDDPAVVEEIATRVSTAIVTQLNLQDRVAEVLPDRAKVLAGPISTASTNYLEQATQELVGTEQFRAAWETALAASHDVTIKILKGDTEGVVTNDNGDITLNLVPLINTVLESASNFLAELLNREITLPPVSADQVDQAVTAIEKEFNVDLPSDFGQVTLFSSDKLALAQDAYKAASVAAWLMPIAALVLIGLALAAAPRRGRMFLTIVLGTALTLGFVAVVVQPLKSSILGALQDDGLRTAVAAGIQTTFSTLRTGVFVALVIGVIAAAILFFTGRSKAAVAARSSAGRVPPLAGRYPGAFVAGGVVAAVVLLALIPGRGWGQIAIALLLLAGYTLAVLLAPRNREPVEMDAGTADSA